MLTRTEFQQVEVALDTMGGINIASGGDVCLYVPVQNVKVLIATFVQGAKKKGNKVTFPVFGQPGETVKLGEGPEVLVFPATTPEAKG